MKPSLKFVGNEVKLRDKIDGGTERYRAENNPA